MGIRIQWEDEQQQVIHMIVEGRWTWDEFYAAMDETHALMDQSSLDRIDFVVDVQQGNMMPDNVLSHMQRVSRGHHPKSNRMVMVGANAFVRAMYGIMDRMMPDRTRTVFMVKTMEEARILLAQPVE